MSETPSSNQSIPGQSTNQNEPQISTNPGERGNANLIYILYLAAAVVGITGIVGLIMAYLLEGASLFAHRRGAHGRSNRLLDPARNPHLVYCAHRQRHAGAVQGRGLS